MSEIPVFLMGTQTTVPCVQAEDSGLLGPLQSPNWVKVCLVSTVSVLSVSIVLGVEKCLGQKNWSILVWCSKSVSSAQTCISDFFLSLLFVLA